MKQLTFISLALFVGALPLDAAPSSHFSTVPGTAFAWQLNRTDGNWLLSFPINSSQIDNSSPADTSLLGDYVNLPAMAVTDLQDHGMYLTATLTPIGPLTIVSDVGGVPVLTASMAPGNSLFIGTNYLAYSNIRDDLDIINYVPAYSLVIDEMVAGEAGGLPLDISFSGDVAGGLDLVAALREAGGPDQLTGTSLSGQITIVPVPGALLLAGVGTLAVGFLRWRVLS
jgi:hypothetical protein